MLRLLKVPEIAFGLCQSSADLSAGSSATKQVVGDTLQVQPDVEMLAVRPSRATFVQIPRPTAQHIRTANHRPARRVLRSTASSCRCSHRYATYTHRLDKPDE